MKKKATSGSGKSTETTKPEEKPRLIPDKIKPSKLGDYLEIMTIAVFQAGVSWALIQSKWTSFRKAFGEFDPAVVAKYKQSDVARLMEDPGIIRSEKKILGTIANARTLIALDTEFGGFQNYLRSHKSYDKLSADIRRRFKHVGELSVYYLLFRVGEPVPPFEEWSLTIEGDHPRMREMVEKSALEAKAKS